MLQNVFLYKTSQYQIIPHWNIAASVTIACPLAISQPLHEVRYSRPSHSVKICAKYVKLNFFVSPSVPQIFIKVVKYFVSFNFQLGESNGKLPLRTCSGCSVPEPYRSPDWALVPAKTGPRAEY